MLFLIDADEDCAKQLCLKIRPIVENFGLACAVVVAVRELEGWFLADPGLYSDLLDGALASFPSPESVRGAKEKLSAMMSDGYVETFHQPKFADRLVFNNDLFVKCPSAKYFYQEVLRIAASNDP